MTDRYNNTNIYRPDIDGLRSVAVIPVILFHAGFLSFHGIPLAPGGFVGVDIFFVISGFLISGVIYSEISGNSYSVFSFYARRIRRVFPALFLVYVTCLIWGTFRGVFSDIEEIRNATIASVFFTSNIYFSAHAGYFDSAIQNDPLLHTWSLSIEEQFYIILPIILLALRSLSHAVRIKALCIIVAASFSASVYLSHVYPDIAYYSLAARTWELGLGGLLAIIGIRVHSKFLAEALGVLGVLAIFIAVVYFDKNTEFPSYTALLPTLGAASIILSGSSGITLVSRLLSLKPLRQVGLISYSLYLWHWPILVVSRIEGFEGNKNALIAIAICIILSWFSWRFVEQPFRFARNKATSKRTVAFGMIAASLVIALSLGSVLLNSFLLPMNDQAKLYAEFDPKISQSAMRPGSCFLTSRYNSISFFRKDQCLNIATDRPNVLLLGDSHAAQYIEAIKILNPKANIMQATSSGCLPILNTVGERRCVDIWNLATLTFLPKNSVDLVILSGRWGRGDGSRAFGTAKYLLKFSKKVLIIGPNEEFTTMMPRAIIKASIMGDMSLVHRFENPLPREVDKEFAFLARLNPAIVYISFFKTMCTPVCPIFSSTGDPLDFDNNHLSLSASIDLIKKSSLSKYLLVSEI